MDCSQNLSLCGQNKICWNLEIYFCVNSSFHRNQGPSLNFVKLLQFFFHQLTSLKVKYSRRKWRSPNYFHINSCPLDCQTKAWTKNVYFYKQLFMFINNSQPLFIFIYCLLFYVNIHYRKQLRYENSTRSPSFDPSPC